MNMTQLVHDLVSGLVADKEAVSVKSKELSRSVNIFVQVGEFDQGKVLGQRRSTLDALIRISELAGANEGKLVRIELLEPVKTGKTPPPHQFIAQADWDRENYMRLLFQTLKGVFGQGDIVASKIQDTVTVYEVKLNNKASHAQAVEAIQRDFETLFHAIGKSFKHVCHVDLILEE